MSEILVFKATGKKDEVYDIQIKISCFFCGEGKKGLPQTFDNLQTLIRHLEQCHYSHPHYRTLRNGLKKFLTITKYYTPKVLKV